MKTVNAVIISNEWFMSFNPQTKEIIVKPTFIDGNTSAIVGENLQVESFETEQDCYNRINELGLIIEQL